MSEFNALEKWLVDYSTYILLAGSLLVIIATHYASKGDAKQKDDIQTLGEVNVLLGRNIEAMAKINEEVTAKIDTITEANQLSIAENLKLTNSVKELTAEAKVLTEESKRLIEKVNTRTEYAEEEGRKSGVITMDFASFDPNEYISISSGSNLGRNTLEAMQKGARFLSIGGEDPFNMEIDNKGEITITMTLYDLNGNTIAEIHKNEWRPNPNFSGKFNYDDHGFEVINNQGDVAISIDLKAKNTITINGIFPLPNSNTLLICGTGMQNLPLQKSGTMIFDPFRRAVVPYDNLVRDAINKYGTKPIFEYFGKGWLHKRK